MTLMQILEVERHEKPLSIAHMEDKKYIQRLEKELLNCSQEIGIFYSPFFMAVWINICIDELSLVTVFVTDDCHWRVMFLSFLDVILARIFLRNNCLVP
jgi:hypothetical protein